MDFCTFYQLINYWGLPLRGESKLVGFSKQASLPIPAEPPKAKDKSQEKGSAVGNQQPLLPEAGGGETTLPCYRVVAYAGAQGHIPATEAAGCMPAHTVTYTAQTPNRTWDLSTSGHIGTDWSRHPIAMVIGDPESSQVT